MATPHIRPATAYDTAALAGLMAHLGYPTAPAGALHPPRRISRDRLPVTAPARHAGRLHIQPHLQMDRIIIAAVFVTVVAVPVLALRWVHAPAGFVADLPREEMQKRVQIFRRRANLWSCWCRAIVLVALLVPPVVGQLAFRGGLISRDTLMSVAVVCGTVWILTVPLWVAAPVVLARRLRLFCPNCRRLMVAAGRVKEARRGQCCRCGHVVARRSAG